MNLVDLVTDFLLLFFVLLVVAAACWVAGWVAGHAIEIATMDREDWW